MRGAAADKFRGELAQLAVSIAQTQHPIRGQRYISILRFCSFGRQVPRNIPTGGLLADNNIDTGCARPLSRDLKARRLRSRLGRRYLGTLCGGAF